MKKTARMIWMIVLIFLCIYPMKLNPIWNGEYVYQKGQYEETANSILNGHFYLDIETTPEFLAVENPYDPEQRAEAGVNYYWDRAYYNGHFYMYFGVVPVYLLYIPYQLITGKSLTNFRSTQVFTAFIIIGLFCLTDFLRGKFFPKMNDLILTAVTTALCLASVWYFSDAPALYCTAISSAVCMMVWSLCFYIRAVYDDLSFNKRIVFAVLGAITGALAFGCRPTVALANVIAIPLFILFLKTNEIERKDRYKIILIFLPYLIIGSLLMAYNYARFDDPFEFGQKYQMTAYNQADYTLLKGLGPVKQINGFIAMFFQTAFLDNSFPYLNFGGIFFEFPVFLLSIAALLASKPARDRLRKLHLLWLVYGSGIAILLITITEVAMSPIILERYHQDVIFLLSMIAFLTIGAFYTDADEAAVRKYNVLFFILAGITALTAVLLFFVPNDMNLTEYYPELLAKLRRHTWTFK